MLPAQPVKIPEEKGVFIKKAGKQSERYVYKRTRYYRNVKGQPTSSSVCIGKVCPDDPTMMIPNEHYFSLHGIPLPTAAPQTAGSAFESTAVLHYGATFVFFQIAEDIGLLDALESCIGREMAPDLIAVAAYRLETGGLTDGMDVWQDTAFLPYDAQSFSASRITSIFELSGLVREEILEIWIARNRVDDCMCWVPHPGPRGNTVFFSSLANCRPLSYSVCKGSLQNPAVLSGVLEDASEMGLYGFHLFADSSCFSSKCFAAYRRSLKSFTVAVPLESSLAQASIDAVSSDIQNMSSRIIDWHVHCMEVPGTAYQTAGRILVFYSAGKANAEHRETDDEILALENALEGMKQVPKDKAFARYFKVAPRTDGEGLDFSLDLEKVNAEMKYHGFSVFFTTNQNLTPSEILEHYQAQAAVEDLFYQERPPLYFRRTKAPSPAFTEGSQFASFLAALLAQELMHRLTPYLHSHPFSLYTVLAHLQSILLACGPGGSRLVQELTQEQQEILKALGMKDRLLQSVHATSCNAI